jgi:6-phosphogluconolactonase
MAENNGTPIVRQCPDLEALSRAAARDLGADIEAATRTQETYTLALAGGGTPERLYELLAAGTGGPFPWDQIHLFWGDERYVPHDDPESNARLATRTLVRQVPIPETNVHPIPTQRESPEAAAATYTETLQQHFSDRTATFDTVLLGLGSDGHTASIFPETLDRDADRNRWVRVVTAPPRHDVATRLTCTLPVLNGARRACVLVAGERKREALRGVLDREDPSLPATHVQPRDRCLWYVDQAARPGDRGGD